MARQGATSSEGGGIASASAIPTCVLITGANSGLGFECARQLACIEGVQRILLACRSMDKATAAKERLEHLTSSSTIFKIILMDVSRPSSVRNAVEKLKDEALIDGVVLNAGGGGGPDPTDLTADGVTNSIAANVLGHVVLVEELIKANKLSGQAASVVYSGSESARGVSQMSLEPPKLESGTVEEFVSICDGSYFPKDAAHDQKYVGSFSKLVGTLWMSKMARKHPEIRFVTMSPGATKGTAVRRDLPCSKRMFVGCLLNILSLSGKAHSLEVGAKRYVDALIEHSAYKSGIFYGSKVGLSGELCDQAKLLGYFANEQYQDNAGEAIQRFIHD